MNNLSTDVMIDIETLGVGPRAPIIQIAAVPFNLESGDFSDAIGLNLAPDLKKYEACLDTIIWWINQDDKTRHSVFERRSVPVGDGLRYLNEHLAMHVSPDARYWAKSPSFDLVILENAYETDGDDLDVPWRYDAHRDVRTIFELAGLKKEDRTKPLVAHDAVSDCVAQIEDVIRAWRIIKGKD